MIRWFLYLTFGIIYSPLLMGNEVSDSLFYENHLDQFYKTYHEGTYQKGFSAINQALKGARKAWGKHSEQYIKAHNNLPMLHVELGQFRQALPLFNKTESLIQSSVGKHHRSYPILLNNWAYAYREMGCYDQALKLFQKGRHFSKKVLGTDHPLHPIIINNIGNTLEQKGYVDSVRPLYEKALSLDSIAIDALYQEQHAHHLMDFARLTLKEGKQEKALAYYQKAKTLFHDTIGTDHPDYALVLKELGQFYQQTGKWVKAKRYFELARAHTEKYLGEQHSQYLACLNHLAISHTQSGDHKKALRYHNQLQTRVQEQLFKKFSFLTDQERANYLTHIQKNFEQFQAFTAKLYDTFEQLPGKVYNHQLLLNNLLLKQSTERNQQIKQENLQTTYRDWRELKQTLARQYALPREKRIDHLDSIAGQAQQLERKLVRESAKFKGEHARSFPSWREVQKKLEGNEAAIEFLAFPAGKGTEQDSIRYAALLVKNISKVPHFIPLCRERMLRKMLTKSDTASEKAYVNHLYHRDQHGTALYKSLWEDLEPYLKDAQTVYFNPDGLLHQISFKAIPHPEEPYLSDRYQLVRLSSTGKLTKPVPEPRQSSITLFGGIRYDYDTTDKQTLPDQPQMVMKNLPGYQKTRSIRGDFQYLSGSFDEVQTIEGKMDEVAETCIISGEKATESRFKEFNNNSSKVLHIATHGYFFPDHPEEKGSAKNTQLVFKHARNPMLRSGLAMAGSNYAWEHGYNPYEEENGILTGYEIANMDLDETDLVVLSACETGLGEIRGSEGVYGLQRAFRLAGVEYLIMSLWKVPDEPTRELMTLFYENWLSGQSVRQAFNQAQQEMAQQYPPYFWGAFVLVGGGKADFQESRSKMTFSRWSLAGGAGFFIGLLFLYFGIYRRVFGKWV